MVCGRVCPSQGAGGAPAPCSSALELCPPWGEGPVAMLTQNWAHRGLHAPSDSGLGAGWVLTPSWWVMAACALATFQLAGGPSVGTGLWQPQRSHGFLSHSRCPPQNCLLLLGLTAAALPDPAEALRHPLRHLRPRPGTGPLPARCQQPHQQGRLPALLTAALSCHHPHGSLLVPLLPAPVGSSPLCRVFQADQEEKGSSRLRRNILVVP